jgi:hypothetical protein
LQIRLQGRGVGGYWPHFWPQAGCVVPQVVIVYGITFPGRLVLSPRTGVRLPQGVLLARFPRAFFVS